MSSGRLPGDDDKKDILADDYIKKLKALEKAAGNLQNFILQKPTGPVENQKVSLPMIDKIEQVFDVLKVISRQAELQSDNNLIKLESNIKSAFEAPDTDDEKEKEAYDEYKKACLEVIEQIRKIKKTHSFHHYITDVKRIPIRADQSEQDVLNDYMAGKKIPNTGTTLQLAQGGSEAKFTLSQNITDGYAEISAMPVTLNQKQQEVVVMNSLKNGMAKTIAAELPIEFNTKRLLKDELDKAFFGINDGDKKKFGIPDNINPKMIEQIHEIICAKIKTGDVNLEKELKATFTQFGLMGALKNPNDLIKQIVNQFDERYAEANLQKKEDTIAGFRFPSDYLLNLAKNTLDFYVKNKPGEIVELSGAESHEMAHAVFLVAKLRGITVLNKTGAFANAETITKDERNAFEFLVRKRDLNVGQDVTIKPGQTVAAGLADAGIDIKQTNEPGGKNPPPSPR